MRIILLALLTLLSSCSNSSKKSIAPNSEIKLTTIVGNSTDFIGKTVYLKDNNHFNFLLEEFELDSAVIDSEGDFKLEVEIKEPKLIRIDYLVNTAPGTLREFKNTPEHYQYLLCKNFLGNYPTLYIEPGKKYKIINWDKRRDTTSVIYEDSNQNQLRKYYWDAAYYDAVRKNRKVRNLEIDVAWERVKKLKDSLITDLNLNSEIDAGSFKHYLKSEVVLGASNWFFNWFDSMELTNYKHPSYREALSVYYDDEWNKGSLHYFKVTERLINTKLNEKYGSFKVYYEPSKDKLEMATKYAGENIVEQYAGNIKKLLN